MSTDKERETIKKFRDRTARGDIRDDMRITYRVSGGMPHESVHEELTLSGGGGAKAVMRDALRPMLSGEAPAKLEEAEARDIFKQVGLGLDDMVTRSEARFVPDSVVGSVTIEVEGDKTTLYFLADEEERAAQGKPLAPPVADAIKGLRKISLRTLKKGEDHG